MNKLKNNAFKVLQIGVVVTSISMTAYFYSKISSIKNENLRLTNEISKKSFTLSQMNDKLKFSEITGYDRVRMLAQRKFPEHDIFAMAANISFECPSHRDQKVDRCSETEAYAIGYATKNLYEKSLRGEADYGTSISEVVYDTKGGGTRFSWVNKVKLTKEFLESDIFMHSLKMAYYILSEDKETEEKYNHGQEYYCRPDISNCPWHKKATKDGDIVKLGPINLDKNKDSFFVKNTSFHVFYKEVKKEVEAINGK